MHHVHVDFTSIGNEAGSLLMTKPLSGSIYHRKDISWIVDEMAFFLDTHDFDATFDARIEDGRAAVRRGDTTYKMVMDGDIPGFSKSMITD